MPDSDPAPDPDRGRSSPGRKATKADIRSSLSSAAPGRGIALVTLSGLLFTVNDSLMKWLRADYPVGEAVCVRGLFSLVFLFAFAYFMGGWGTLRIRAWRAQIIRAALVIITTVCFIAAIRYMPLADAMGIAFAGPLFTVAFAGPLLGERIGWRRWSAVMVGFCGVLLMINPSASGFQVAAILPLITALGSSLRDIITRRMSLADHSNATLLVSIVGVVVFGAVTWPLGSVWASQQWIVPTMTHLGLFLVTGLLMGAGQYCLIEALRGAEVALIAPFKYTSYVWALMLGFALWGDLPSAMSVAGVMLVVTSGLYVFFREQSLARRRANDSRGVV